MNLKSEPQVTALIVFEILPYLFDLDLEDDYMVTGGTPSERLIVDLSDLTKTLLIHPTGQSGHAGHENYIDMVDLWVNIQYNPLLWEYSQVQENAAHFLTFLP